MTTSYAELGSHNASGEAFKDRRSFLDGLVAIVSGSAVVATTIELDTEQPFVASD